MWRTHCCWGHCIRGRVGAEWVAVSHKSCRPHTTPARTITTKLPQMATWHEETVNSTLKETVNSTLKDRHSREMFLQVCTNQVYFIWIVQRYSYCKPMYQYWFQVEQIDVHIRVDCTDACMNFSPSLTLDISLSFCLSISFSLFLSLSRPLSF